MSFLAEYQRQNCNPHKTWYERLDSIQFRPANQHHVGMVCVALGLIVSAPVAESND